MKIFLSTAVLLCAVNSFAYGDGDYCEDRLHDIISWSYQQGHHQGVLTHDSILLFPKLGNEGRLVTEEGKASAYERVQYHLKLLREKGCLNYIRE